jgi:hypothetical protein
MAEWTAAEAADQPRQALHERKTGGARQAIPPIDCFVHGVGLYRHGFSRCQTFAHTATSRRSHNRRQESQEEKGEGFIRRETSYGSFERALQLLSDVNTEDLKASYDNGIVEVVVPRGAKRASQRVKVDIGKKK